MAKLKKAFDRCGIACNNTIEPVGGDCYGRSYCQKLRQSYRGLYYEECQEHDDFVTPCCGVKICGCCESFGIIKLDDYKCVICGKDLCEKCSGCDEYVSDDCSECAKCDVPNA